jgi:hypothetical protein
MNSTSFPKIGGSTQLDCWNLFMTLYLIPLATSWGYAPLNFPVRNDSLQKLASKTCSFDCSNAVLSIPLRTRRLSYRVFKNKFLIFTEKDRPVVQCMLYCHRCCVCSVTYSKNYVHTSQKTYWVSLDLNFLQPCAVFWYINPRRLPPIFFWNVVEFPTYFIASYPRRPDSLHCKFVTKPH